MARILLYTTRRSPPGRAVEITSKMIGIDLDVKIVDLVKKEQMADSFLKLNPLHTVPTILDSGVSLFDSHAIMIYLVSKYATGNSLYPKDLVTQARINAFMHFESGVLFSRLRAALVPVSYHGSIEVPRDKIDNVHGAYDLLEGTLQSDYLIGNSMTLADISCSTSLATLNALFPVDSDKCPKLIDYIERLKQNMPYYEKYNENRAKESKTFFEKRLEENRIVTTSIF